MKERKEKCIINLFKHTRIHTQWTYGRNNTPSRQRRTVVVPRTIMSFRTWNSLCRCLRTIEPIRTGKLDLCLRTVEASETQTRLDSSIRTEGSVVAWNEGCGRVSRTVVSSRTRDTVKHTSARGFVTVCSSRAVFRYQDPFLAVLTDRTGILRVVRSSCLAHKKNAC